MVYAPIKVVKKTSILAPKRDLEFEAAFSLNNQDNNGSSYTP